jgi:5-methylcytosine-specific restriction endonuclease McrA
LKLKKLKKRKKGVKKRVNPIKVKPIGRNKRPRKFTPLTKKEYAQALRDPRWQKKRLKIFQRDGWRCRKCGSKKITLVVHHLKYTRKYPWNEPDVHLITWCEKCHNKEHGFYY